MFVFAASVTCVSSVFMYLNFVSWLLSVWMFVCNPRTYIYIHVYTSHCLLLNIVNLLIIIIRHRLCIYSLHILHSPFDLLSCFTALLFFLCHCLIIHIHLLLSFFHYCLPVLVASCQWANKSLSYTLLYCNDYLPPCWYGIYNNRYKIEL